MSGYHFIINEKIKLIFFFMKIKILIRKWILKREVLILITDKRFIVLFLIKVIKFVMKIRLLLGIFFRYSSTFLVFYFKIFQK